MDTYRIILAGFGGQGVLFAGKLLAYAALFDNREVSWLPSYGPEMRGGTANCSVTVSKDSVDSPLITEPNVLIAMNKPSYDKFEDAMTKDGIAIIDSTLIDRKAKRDDVKTFYIPATQLAQDNELKGLSNVILIGKLLKETGIFDLDTFKKSMEKNTSPKKLHLLDKNFKALEIGYNF
ncbi:MAG: 2-oxoacid:acceptor oxidoreductase family protein [Clostridia bacterium]|nr:2-oxoacid:acceptor oxidoreductase family protein [Clostridia bacterium]